MNNIPSKTFCILPFNAVCVGQESTIRPCCHFRMDNTLGVVSNDSNISQALQTEKYKKLRLDHLEGIENSGCTSCYESERQGRTSMRNVWNKRYEETIKNLNTITEEYIQLEYIETGFGNLCNLSCKMCNTISSSTFQSIVSPDTKFQRIYFGGIDAWSNVDLSKLNRIKLVGGEPMMEPGHIDFLKKLTSESNCSNITLNYYTNTTKKPSDIIVNFWKKFKKIELSHSIDGIENIQSYQRPGNYIWSDVLSTLDYYFKLGEEIDIEHDISCVVTPLNIMQLPEFFNWAEDKFRNKKFILRIHSTRNPYWANIQNLKNELKDTIRPRLELIKDKNKHGYANLINALNSSPVNSAIGLEDIFNDPIVNTISKYYEQEDIEGKIYESYFG